MEKDGIKVSTPAGSVEAEGRSVVMLVVIVVGFMSMAYVSHVDHASMASVIEKQSMLLEKQMELREEELRERRIGNWLQSIPQSQRPRLPMPPEAYRYIGKDAPP